MQDNTWVIDCEIQDPILHPDDWNHTERIKIACCVAYSYLEDRYHVFGPSDVEHLRNIIIAADLIVGYNSNKFDLPVIFGMENRQFPEGVKTYDILAKIWIALGLDPLNFTDAHKGYSLNSVAGITLGRHKTGSGASAPFWYKQGNIWRVIDYCISDVALTKELYEHIKIRKEVNTKFGIVKMETV